MEEHFLNYMLQNLSNHISYALIVNLLFQFLK